MKIKVQKLMLSIVVTITIFNLLLSLFETTSNQVLATESSGTTTVVEEIDEEAEEDSIFENIYELPGFLIDGLAGFLSKAIQIPIFLIAMGLQGIISGIAKLEGSKIEGLVTPDDIIFNRVGITNIDFFTISGNSDNIVQTMRTNIATWYYILRVLATVILLAVLIYIGIRMALSTVASEQAQYKRMLKDWMVSFALLFLLNYIIVFTIQANNALVELLKGPAKATLGDGVMTSLAKTVILGRATKSWAAFIAYFGLIGMTTVFLYVYIRRMLTIGFLIIISPLITITYSIDKVKDGRAQAFNTWMKEFMYNVLIQPFHCIIYLVFISTIISSIGAKASIVKILLAIVCMKFVWNAEKIIKSIFGFNEASTMGESSLAAIAAVHTVAQTLTKQGGKVANVVTNNTTFGQNLKNKISSTRVGRAYTNASQRNDLIGMGARAINPRRQFPKAVGVAAASIEMGLNTNANAAQVGVSAYNVAKSWMFGDENQPGSPQSIQHNQEELKKYADYISNNNNFNFQNYGTDINSKNNLKAYAQTLIGANMDHLNNNIQDALRTLTTTPEYDITTNAGMQHLKDLQAMALDSSLDFTNPRTNPLGRAWSTDEINAVTAIQIRNLAVAVNGLNSDYQAAGRQNPNQDVDDYINSLT